MFVTRLLSGVVLVIIAFVLFFKLKGSSVSDNSDKYAGVDFDTMSSEYQREGQYSDYVAKRTDTNTPSGSYDIPVAGFVKKETTKNVTVHNDLGPENEKSESVLIPEGESAVYSVNVEEEGYYNLNLEYYPSTGDKDDRGIAIETKVELYNEKTGKYETPFNGAEGIDFERVYTDDGKPSKDNQGNEIRPSQIEDPTRGWISSYFEDPTGYEMDPYYFYFKKGVNKIRLTGVNERLIMRKFTVGNMKKIPTYAEYAAENKGKTNNVDKSYVQKIQGEKSDRRSSPSLYATYDRTSGDTEYEDEKGNVTKHNTDKQVLNVIGGTQWKVAGDWLEWTTKVEKEGDYVIGIKGRQGYNRGYIANRSLYIDGEVPFKEVASLQFTYSNVWEMLCLQNDKGEAYKFHLTAGEHKIRLKITLGELGEYLSQLSESVYRMNQYYRQILVLTGTEPDEFRDYQIEKVYPDIIKAMGDESKILYRLVDEVTAYTGERGGEIAVAQTLAAQMEEFVDRPDKIPQTLSNFKENVSSLGTSINNLSATAMDIDYIVLAGDKSSIEEVNEGSFDRIVHECTLFINSFRSDSSALGNVYDSDDPDVIDVWITAGRDQSNILKNMVDQQFTPTSKETYGKEIEETFHVTLSNIDVKFPRITFQEAKRILKEEMNFVGERTDDFERHEEELLCKYAKEKYNSDFIFVTKFPFEARPFYHMLDENGLTKSYDLLFKGVEITTGAIREHRVDILTKQIIEKEIDPKSLQFYLEFFKYGCPPHGGFAIGIARMMMEIFEIDNIREATFIYRGPTRLNP